jgi:hypothetical protein
MSKITIVTWIVFFLLLISFCLFGMERIWSIFAGSIFWKKNKYILWFYLIAFNWQRVQFVGSCLRCTRDMENCHHYVSSRRTIFSWANDLMSRALFDISSFLCYKPTRCCECLAFHLMTVGWGGDLVERCSTVSVVYANYLPELMVQKVSISSQRIIYLHLVSSHFDSLFVHTLVALC